MKTVFNIIDLINRKIGWVVMFVIFPISIFTFAEVVLRYAFHSPTDWSNELVRYIFGFYSLTVGGYILLKDSHVRIDILYVKLSPYVRAVVNCINYSLVLLFAGVLVYTGWVTAWEGLLKAEISPSAWGPPYWPYKMVLPVGCFLLLLAAAVKLVANLRYVVSRKGGV